VISEPVIEANIFARAVSSFNVRLSERE
jgi:hypothetical protein